jgi:putative ATP-binding cassette transporter
MSIIRFCLNYSRLPELKATGKTVFVINHDDRYYYMADRTITFDDGQIVRM